MLQKDILPNDELFQVRLVENEAEEYETDSGEEEEWWHPEVKQGEKVQVVDGPFASFSTETDTPAYLSFSSFCNSFLKFSLESPCLYLN